MRGPRVLRSSIKSPLSRNNYRGYRPCWITAKSTRPIYPNGKWHASSTPSSITHPSGWISSWLFISDNLLPAFLLYICENYLFFVYCFFLFIRKVFWITRSINFEILLIFYWKIFYLCPFFWLMFLVTLALSCRVCLPDSRCDSSTLQSFFRGWKICYPENLFSLGNNGKSYTVYRNI